MGTLSSELLGHDLWPTRRLPLSEALLWLAREHPHLAAREAPIPAKAIFLAKCDVIGDEAGIMIGHPEDWSTYYMRIFAMRPAHQARFKTRAFLREIIQPLSVAGMERLECDCAPGNQEVAAALRELRFYPTGHKLSERWGALVRYTKYLQTQPETEFVHRFGIVKGKGDTP